MDSVGFVILCAYLLSGYANEWSLRLFGKAAYISTIAVMVAPLFWILSRNRFRGVRCKIGVAWLVFLVCLVADVPFSYWRRGSLDMLINYLPRSYSLFFLITAFVTSTRRCRAFLLVQITGAVAVLVSCYIFGVSSDDGRLLIPNSLFFSNSNDLGLQLLLGITLFTFLFYSAGIFKKVFAVVCIAVSFMYMLRTGSRGCLVGAILYCVLILLYSQRKMILATLMLGAALLGTALTPIIASQRLMLLWNNTPTARSNELGSAVASESSRKELLYRSIIETFKHPLFGVGPGQFPVAFAGAAEKRGERPEWLGTHNSYTQISSECGIPAFICYAIIIVVSFRISMRLFKRARQHPQLREISGMSFTVLSGIWVYAICTTFFHMAYTGGLPILSGLAVALALSSDSMLKENSYSRPVDVVAVTT